MDLKRFFSLDTNRFLQLFIILSLQERVNSSNILFFGFLGSLSHHIAIHPLAVRLAENGHNVTYFSSVKLKNEEKGITYFYPEKVVDIMSGILSTVGEQSLRGTDAPNVFTSAYHLALMLCQTMYESEDVQTWISKSSFDLLILDAVYSDCALGLAYKFGVPHIAINPTSFFP